MLPGLVLPCLQSHSTDLCRQWQALQIPPRRAALLDYLHCSCGGANLLTMCCVAPQIPFTRYNIEDMLRVSDRLRVELVKEACTAYLEREMTSYNVLETLLL